ncbi:MAG TPA: S-layer homology domain-containing protein [Thermoanaerobaculia bacterium]|nr:S-layer homology domain-containing protein [Thermoanaerobaculia bacterium]
MPASSIRRFSVSILAIVLGAATGLLGVCGPFNDVAADAFCPFILEIFTLGITTGTTATTYDPSSNVTRLQMGAFLSRTVDGIVRRTSRRAVMKRFRNLTPLPGLISIPGGTPQLAESDGTDIWVAHGGFNGEVSRVRASDGNLLGTWTGANNGFGVVVGRGAVWITGAENPGKIYGLNASDLPGSVLLLADNLGDHPRGIAWDGNRLWTANQGGSVSIVTLGGFVTTVTTGFSGLAGALDDGSNVWVTDFVAGTLLKLNDSGAILQTVTVGTTPQYPVFDGANIWVPNAGSASVSIVRASSGAVLATLTGNGLNTPAVAGFDGERVLVTNSNGVSLWKAAGLTPLGSQALANQPLGVCSDGLDFWISLRQASSLVRF